MNKIVFESIAIVFCLLINRDGNLSTTCGSFLILTIAFRLIWNSAILIHGIGHSLYIAAVDRSSSALQLNNILEHRSISSIIRSLLPFSSIYFPGLDNSNSPWLSAGDPTPWRIRCKAWGGIGCNLLAIALTLAMIGGNFISLPENIDDRLLSKFLSQSFIAANTIIAFSSVSDFVALFTGMATNFYCGNFGFICQHREDDEPVLLPERMLNMYYLMGQETEIRGEQAGGGLVVAQDRQQQVCFVGKKVVNKKRDNLSELPDSVIKDYAAGFQIHRQQQPQLTYALCVVLHYLHWQSPPSQRRIIF